jgi:hypothetical protein
MRQAHKKSGRPVGSAQPRPRRQFGFDRTGKEKRNEKDKNLDSISRIYRIKRKSQKR